MKSKNNSIERNRLRWDYVFSRMVTVFGLLVLATFVTLIWHVFSNVFPLFRSPDINLQHSVAFQTARGEVDLGITELNGEWYSLRYANCTISVISLNQPTSTNAEGATLSPQVSKSFAPDCNKMPLKLFGNHHQYLATISQRSGLLEIFLIESKIGVEQADISLLLQGSFTLPRAVLANLAHDTNEHVIDNMHSWLAQWSLDFDGGTIAMTRGLQNNSSAQAEQSSTLSVYHNLSSLAPITTNLVPNALSVTPILNRQTWLVVTRNDLRQLQLMDKNAEQQQTLLFADDISHVRVSTNALDVYVLTANQQLHKYVMVNSDGEFLLKPVYSTQLENTTDNSPAFSKTEIPELADPNFNLVFDNPHNMVIAIQKNGRASIINAVTGEIVNKVELLESNKVAYARSQLVLRHAEHYGVYELNDLQGITSLQSLFGENHYSAYPTPAYVWQTSAASDMQSPKYSIVPLLMGSIKASLLALIIALPLALGGAIYTSYFAKPRMRNVIKPTIEMLEAIPSVIIGFIAAVWLAPIAEQYLVSVFAVFVLFPFVVIVIAAIHGFLLPKLAFLHSEYWDFALSSMLLVLAVILIFSLSTLIIDWSATNDVMNSSNWASGVTLSKTAIVVSLALGIAISPTIYTLIDDALFEVPEGMKHAAFALGATPIQTLTKVVLVVALPSIIAAVMLGFGRAFGETMIVLMVTGNTPIANWDLFSGLRTLTSNIAIELHEAQVESTLYYILFLTAAILFVFTFIVNTAAGLLKRNMRRDS